MSATHPSQPSTVFPGLYGVRAVGALFVLVTHVGFHSGAALNTSFAGLLSRLDSGVAIFFVLSGFLLFRPHCLAWLHGRPHPTVGRYLWHRVLRIVPALWIAVVASAVLLEQADVPVSAWVRNATLTQVYSAGNEAQGLTQMWSLATEVAFYLLLPLLGRALTHGTVSARAVTVRLGVLLSTPLVGAAWMSAAAASGDGLRPLWLPGFIGWFGLGMALSLWQTARASGWLPATHVDLLVRYPGTTWSLAAGLLLVLTSPVAGPYSLTAPTPGEAATKNLLYGLVAVLIVLPAVGGSQRTPAPVRTLGGPVARFLGEISYGIFCYHLVVLGLVEQLLDYTIFTGGFVRLLIPTLAGTIAVAALSYYLLERPIMDLGRRNEKTSRPAKVALARATSVSKIGRAHV